MKKFILIFLVTLAATFFDREGLIYADEIQRDETQQVGSQSAQTGPRPGMLSDKWLKRHPEKKARLDTNQDGIVDMYERRAARQAMAQNRPQLPQLPVSTPIGAAQRLKNRPRPLLQRARLANSQEAPVAEGEEQAQDQGQTTPAP